MSEQPTTWPQWAIDSRRYREGAGEVLGFLRWTLDREGRIWATDGCTLAWMRNGIDDGHAAPGDMAGSMVSAAGVRVTEFVELVPVCLADGHAALIAGGACFNVARAIMLRDWFPDPARWGVVRTGRMTMLTRCDFDGGVLGAIAMLSGTADASMDVDMDADEPIPYRLAGAS